MAERWRSAAARDLASMVRQAPAPIQRCGWRGFAGESGCVRHLGHEGGHGFSDGSGEQDMS